MSTPYREIAAVAPPVEMVEAATCQWCRWSHSSHPRLCSHPVSGGPHRNCGDANPRGQCVHFSTSMLTRMLRGVGVRSPAMVDPRDLQMQAARGGS